MITVNEKVVNTESITVTDVDTNDYPDFVDAYIDYAEFVNGEPLNEEELDLLSLNGELVSEKAFEIYI